MTQKTKTDKDIYQEIKDKFFSLLLKRPCTRKQAEDFLLRSRLPENYAESLMTEAESTGLIDDLTFAKLFIEGHLSWGNNKIIYELNSRGVDREEIDEALSFSENEISRASEIAESLSKTGLTEQKIRTRLLNRGFSSRAVREAVDR